MSDTANTETASNPETAPTHNASWTTLRTVYFDGSFTDEHVITSPDTAATNKRVAEIEADYTMEPIFSDEVAECSVTVLVFAAYTLADIDTDYRH